MAEKCQECKQWIVGKYSFGTKEGKTVCVLCALKRPPEEWKEEKTVKFLATVKQCVEYRKTLDLPEHNNITNLRCEECFSACYKGCPVAEERDKIRPKREMSPLEEKTVKKRIAKGKQFDEVNNDVFVEIGKEEPKKKSKKFGREVENFLYLQSRVLEKLSWHPEIYRALDRLSAGEILDRLVGRSVTESVPTQLGGKMDIKPSRKTEDMFKKLEKQFAEEDEKAGKPAPKDEFDEWEELGFPPPFTNWRDETDGKKRNIQRGKSRKSKKGGKTPNGA